jgi:putative protease
MAIQFTATCLTAAQTQICADSGISVNTRYACSIGEITPGCVTDFSVHCFNSATVKILKSLGVQRATLHPELNLAQIRDMDKIIPVEVIVYGKIPLMPLGNPIPDGILQDRKNTRFFVHNGILYNSVPVFMADKLKEIEQSGVSFGRFIFTTETAAEVQTVINAYKHGKMLKINFTRGKYYSKV